MNLFSGLAITFGLLLGNAFFVAAEFALISARRARVEPAAETGSRIARIVLYCLERVTMLMAAAQLGITICSVALGSISEPIIAGWLQAPFAALGISPSLQHPIAFIIALALVTWLHVVLGEMVPKNLALVAPERASSVLAPPMLLVMWVLYPVIWVLNTLANLVLRAVRVKPQEEVASAFTQDEVAQLVAESRSGGYLESNDERLLLGALQFDSKDVTAVLLPLDEIVTLPVTVTPEQAEQISARSFSRFPVTDEAGAMIGYVHIKDLLVDDPATRTRPMDRELIRRLPTVNADDSLRGALAKMQKARAHLGVVLDATGDVLGIVALEDVLEELVGEVRDDSRRARRAA
ncbi:DUF21 domain-containing protein [Epidermidibacterium keratini]|uniref:DUF21 domain-containing protein n=1 Tax=Epidermidibacterium keratini TaxID=1891644 RepID=A0A7L4YN35_9ACTN|nr:hemolysin family protein [Epidermidibacterium keratini]QHC00462.1 DUF21 domain-containing protein [Epidermidibacterium keratini]